MKTLLALALALCSCGPAQDAPQPVSVTLHDPRPGHVHPPGARFEIEVEVAPTGPASTPVEAGWFDAAGAPLGEPVALGPGRNRLRSPAGAVGYYGLRFTSPDARVSFPPQPAGVGSTEAGFAILPAPAEPGAPNESFFGTVHTSLLDPYLAGGSKTLTWHATRAERWRARNDRLRERGFDELPLVLGEGWKTDDDEPVSRAQLDALTQRLGTYLAADPRLTYWELGLEENAGSAYDAEYFFANLIAKTNAARAAADAAAPKTRFVYHARGFDYEEFEQLFESGAMGGFQVFALHPYRWPDFPAPELWLREHIERVRAIMGANGAADMPLWITEFGLPVRGNNDPEGFFGYPDSGREVPGATREYAARYLVKGHALAADAGCERVYVYNHQNRGDDVIYAEDHFGLRAYTPDRHVVLGHPLPSYVAYVTMLRLLEHAARPVRRRPTDDAWVFDYARAGGDRILCWSYPSEGATIPLTSLRPGLRATDVLAVIDLYGTPLALDGEQVRLSARPLYLLLRP